MQAADELYALPPADFTAARDELARQARSAGDREAAAQIRKLARPTVSAWLVNQLVRAAGPQMSRLYETGQSLHDAQRELAGDRLRELSAQRRQVIAELLPEASRLAAAAGVSVSPAAADEVRVTLEAALADANARTAVRSGQLTRALTYAGLGEVDLTAALAVTPAAGGTGDGTGPREDTRPREDTGPPPTRQARAGQARAEQLGRAVDTAEAAVAAAAAGLSAAEGQATSLAEQRQFLTRRVSHLRHELERAEAEESELARTAKEAQRAAETAAKSLAKAERELDRARQRAETT
jgi:hypothetical protein